MKGYKMDIYILDSSNNPADVIDSFKSVIWNVQFFDVNDFELVVPATPKNIQGLQPGTALVRDMDMSAGEYHNVMMVESYEFTFDVDRGWILTVRGGGLKSILKRRVVWQQTNLTGSVESGIRKVITDNVISPADNSRAIPNFVLDSVQGFTDTFDVQLLGENIAEWLVSTCTLYGIGWDIYIKNGNYVFTMKKGTNRTYNQNVNIPVVFSPKYNNLISSTYTYDLENYANAALVGGEGEGTAQKVASIGTATGLNRYESFVDGSSVSSNGDIITLATYMKMLQDYGASQLAENALNEKYEGQVIPNGMYNLNEDYFLGDLVQIDNEKGIEAVTRILEIIYSEDENGYSLLPTFGEWTGESEV